MWGKPEVQTPKGSMKQSETIEYSRHVNGLLRDIWTEREVEICCVTSREEELHMTGKTKNASMSYHYLNGERIAFSQGRQESLHE